MPEEGETSVAELEKDIETALADMVRRHRGMALKWVCPGWSGVPDRIILLPGGRIIFAELKRPKGGKIASLQQWWAKKLRQLGFTHVFIKNREDIAELEELIEEWHEWD